MYTNLVLLKGGLLQISDSLKIALKVFVKYIAFSVDSLYLVVEDTVLALQNDILQQQLIRKKATHKDTDEFWNDFIVTI